MTSGLMVKSLRQMLVVALCFLLLLFHILLPSQKLLVELTLLEEFPALSDRADCLPYIPCHEGAAVECDEMTICVKPEDEDLVVSANIRRIGEWEGNILDLVLSALQAFPSAAFLDIGSNIGSYSVAVAGMHPAREVIAVDADAVNLAYMRRSLEKNLLWGNGDVRLIHNAVSDKRGLLYLFNNSTYSNPGATKMLDKEELMKIERSKSDGDEKKTRLSSQEGVNAVLLQDLLSSISSSTVVLKIDIEGYECKALQRSILLGESGKFIPVIFLEWDKVVRDSINCPEYKSWKRDYLSGGYLPYESKRGFRRIPDDGSIDNKTDVLSDVLTDVLWVHQSVKLRSRTCQDSSSEQCYMF